MYCIYIVRNKKNGKIYVGYSSNYKRRKKDHFNPKYWIDQPNKYLYRSMEKHGTSNFHMFIIENKIKTKQEALKLEVDYIKKYKLLGYQLYNVTKGGEGGGNPLNNEFEKQCPDCKLVKLHEQFDKSCHGYFGVAVYCKDCTRKQRFIKVRGVNEYKFKGFELNTDTERYCSQCKTIKLNDEFHKDSSKTSGIDGVCKECKSEKMKSEYIPIGKENHKQIGVRLNTETEKYCPHCETLKSRELFGENCGWCMKCKNAHRDQWRIKKREEKQLLKNLNI
jgi:group I intron endonuclease